MNSESTDVAPHQSGLFRNEHGELTRTRATKTVNRPIEVLQDLSWAECLEAAKMTARFDQIESFREAVTGEAFAQTSYQTRARYASYFIKWFLPTVSFDDPVSRCWRGFHDQVALEHVMRWQYVTSNPLISGFVDDQLHHVQPGLPIDAMIDPYLASASGVVNERSRSRLRTNLRKIGLVMEQNKFHYRIEAEVSPKAVALLLAHLFARQPQGQQKVAAEALDHLLAN